MHEVVRHAGGEVLEWRWGTEHELMPDPYWTSAYLVDGLLIDAGAPAGTAELADFLDALPPERAVTQCVLTHAHEDHAGGARYLTETREVPVYAHPRALPLLHAGYDYPDYRQLAWGPALPPAPKVQPLPDPPLATRSGAHAFDLVPMPGHAPCLVALVEMTRQWAFVGDGVLPKYRMLFGGASTIQEDIHAIYTSIQRLQAHTRELPDLQVFVAGHGRFPGQALLRDKLAEIETLHRRAHALAARGLRPRKMLRELLGGESFIGTFTRGDLSRRNLLDELLAWSLDA